MVYMHEQNESASSTNSPNVSFTLKVRTSHICRVIRGRGSMVVVALWKALAVDLLNSIANDMRFVPFTGAIKTRRPPIATTHHT